MYYCILSIVAHNIHVFLKEEKSDKTFVSGKSLINMLTQIKATRGPIRPLLLAVWPRPLAVWPRPLTPC